MRRRRRPPTCNRGRHICRRFRRARTPHCYCIPTVVGDVKTRTCCGCGQIESAISEED